MKNSRLKRKLQIESSSNNDFEAFFEKNEAFLKEIDKKNDK